MILYHGTDIGSAEKILSNIRLDVGSMKVDFGPGFYTTPSVDTAKQWAKRKAIVRKQNPAVVMLEFDEEAAETIIKRFSNDLVWGQFVINNRNGLDYINAISVKEHNLDARYDITYGRIADYDVRDVAIELADTGEMIQDVSRILNPFYAYQYAFHTKASLKYVRATKIDKEVLA